MADIFDEIASSVGGGAAAAPSVHVPTATTAQPDIFDEIAGNTRPTSDVGAIGSGALRGVRGVFSLADELLPQIYKDETGNGVYFPHLFGLFQKKNTPVSFGGDLTKVENLVGAREDIQPSSGLGTFASNVAENAVAGGPFGPTAAFLSGILGGTGATGGEWLGDAIAGEQGAKVGKLAGNVGLQLSPTLATKLPVLKEIAAAIGPTVSQFPILRSIFGQAPVEAAVGRTLGDLAADVNKSDEAIRSAAELIGPKTQLDTLKTVDEIAMDSGLARGKDALGELTNKTGFGEMAAEREAARLGSVTKGLDRSTNLIDKSSVVEQTLSKAAKNIEDLEDVHWGKLDRKALVDTRSLIDKEGNLINLDGDFGQTLSKITVEDTAPLSGKAAGLITRFHRLQDKTDEGIVGVGEIQDLRSDVLKIKRMTDAGAKINPEMQSTNETASALADHLANIIDANAAGGRLPQEVADQWLTARSTTAGKYTSFGAAKGVNDNLGTPVTSKVLKGDPLNPAEAIREGLNNPVKLAGQIQAAVAGGEDVLPAYKQALMAELDNAKPSQWEDLVRDKRQVFETVLTPEELANLDRNLQDVASQLQADSLKKSSNSLTNRRGNVQQIINRGKGISALTTGSATAAAAPAVAGALSGASAGWNRGETLPSKLLLATGGGIGGALLGKAASGAATRTSEAFNSLLAEAIKDPRTYMRAREAAKPSSISSVLGRTGLATAESAAEDAAGRLANSAIRNTFASDKALPPQEEQPTMGKKEDIEAKIDADPIDAATYQAESGRDPLAKNPVSSASGAFQLIKPTAKALGVKDVFDIEDNYNGYKKLRAENEARFGSDPELLYSAHFLGATLLDKVLKQKPLTEDERAQVKELKEKALPRWLEIYQGLVEA